MNRIDAVLQKNKKILSPYITAGDPKPSLTVKLMHALVEGGADILELGIPFSDPMAEGPVIQAAMERALLEGVTLARVFDMVADFRRTDKITPVVLMGYLNPIEYYGYEKFAHDASKCGVDGTIIVDCPPEESHELAAIWSSHDLYPIYLCSPTTEASRMDKINHYAKGYLYYVSIKGVTGAAHQDMQSVKALYTLRKSQTTLPIMVGFGIKSPAMAKAMVEFADGVVVGAQLVEEILMAHRKGEDEAAAARNFMKGIHDAIV